MKLNKTNVTLTADKSKVSLTATVLPEYISNKDVVWTSSNINVATVNSKGVVKSVGNGKATITATSVLGNVKAQCKVEVKGLTHEGMQKAANGNWYYYQNGTVDSDYTGMAKNYRGWWYIKNGALDRTFTGIGTNSYGKWYMKDGALQLSFSGKVTINKKVYVIKNGKVE